MSTTHPRADIRLDQQYALKVAADHLTDDFQGVFGVETIERGFGRELRRHLSANPDVTQRVRRRVFANLDGGHR